MPPAPPKKTRHQSPHLNTHQAFVRENINPTNPALVPAVRKCENEVLAMAAALFHGDEEAS